MAQGRALGRYLLFDEIGAGGMATVHLGRLRGSAGFSRIVAIKRLHAHCARDPQFTSLFLDEARLAGRVRHPNVAAMLDVVSEEQELLLVMDYVHGEPLSRLVALAKDAGGRVPPRIAVAIVVGVLHGLHAAHEARSETGEALGIIHRDVSPQNILVGADGVARLVDFGVAKAASRLQTTAEGQIKGKLAYMAPEQLQGQAIDRRVDVYAASVVLWEALTGRRLFAADNPGSIVARVLELPVVPPSQAGVEAPAALDAVVMRGLSRDAAVRPPTAEQMAAELEAALAPATPREVSAWVASVAAERLEARARLVSAIESSSVTSTVTGAASPVVSELAGAPPGQTRRWMWGAAGALFLAAGSFAVVRGGRAQHTAVAAPPEPPVASAASAQASEVPSPSATSTASAAASASATQTAVPATVRPPSAPARRRHPAGPSCNPPYTLDPNDPRIHVPKPECM